MFICQLFAFACVKSAQGWWSSFLKSFKLYYFHLWQKEKKVCTTTICTQYVLQKGEMILMKCQVVRHNNNNKSFQISSKIPHYYYPSVAKPLTTLKVICQIIFCIMMSPLPVQCNLHADMAFHEKNNSSKEKKLKN